MNPQMHADKRSLMMNSDAGTSAVEGLPYARKPGVRRLVPARAAGIAAGILLLAAVHGGCAPPRNATVESLEGAQPQILPLSFASLEGRRDGDRVNATLEFQNPSNRDRMTIQIEIDLGPPIRLAGGSFLFTGAGRTAAGRVDSSSLDFQAGQSGGMGLGGEFILLNEAGKKLYRVDLPPTLIGVSYR